MSDDADRAQEVLDKAMSRYHPPRAITAPSTGLCKACGNAIPPSRLKVFPFAVRCVPCQQDHESH